MSIFYLVFSFLDFLVIGLADIFSTPQNPMFICAYEDFLLPKNDRGAILLLFDDLFLYLFSLIITHIFYKIPYNHGLLVHNMRGLGSADRLSVKFTTFYNKIQNKSVD